MELLKEENIFSFKSQKQGLSVCVLAGVHGNEKDGVNAINELVKDFSLDRGKVTFILANQEAMNKNVRFVEENLNRCFKEGLVSDSYEFKLAKELKSVLKDYDVCLDLHNSYNPHSEPFIICEKNAFSYINSIDAKKVVSGFDTYEPGGTDYYMNLIGKVGICVECGSIEEDGTLFAKKTITDFLITTNNLEGTVNSFDKEYFDLIECFVPKGPFKLTKPFKDFEFVSKNYLIGVDDGVDVFAKDDSYVLFAKDVDEVNSLNKEAYLLAKKH